MTSILPNEERTEPPHLVVNFLLLSLGAAFVLVAVDFKLIVDGIGRLLSGV